MFDSSETIWVPQRQMIKTANNPMQRNTSNYSVNKDEFKIIDEIKKINKTSSLSTEPGMYSHQCKFKKSQSSLSTKLNKCEFESFDFPDVYTKKNVNINNKSLKNFNFQSTTGVQVNNKKASSSCQSDLEIIIILNKFVFFLFLFFILFLNFSLYFGPYHFKTHLSVDDD